jgi:hypothetical protein
MRLATPAGFEPATPSFEGWWSISVPSPWNLPFVRDHLPAPHRVRGV